jgi:FkbM family methyltransferase
MKTITKLKIAKVLSFVLLFIFRLKQLRISLRNDITYKLDLKQGIDLAIFIFGGFQKKISHTLIKIIIRSKNKKKFSVLDIGSNIGDKTLSLARNLFINNIKNFMIYSIEPTEFAINKQIENLNLNKKYKSKIRLLKFFFQNQKKKVSSSFSSWNLYKKNNIIHGGQNKLFHKDTKVIKLDDFITIKKISNILVIKLDVDGNELDVLQSGKKFLLNNSPVILMEFSPSALEKKNVLFEDFFSFVESINYLIYDLNFKKIFKENLYIKNNSSIDILLIKNLKKH